MKNFRFRLAGYQKIKEFEEKNAWNEVLRQENRVLSLQAKMADIQSVMKKNREERDLLGRDPGMNTHKVDLINSSLLALDARLHSTRGEYLAEHKLLEKLREIHNEKRKDAKVIEKLKERKKEEFKDAKNKWEQKQSNEIAGNIYTRREKKYG